MKAADSIRSKYRALKRGLVEEEKEVTKRYKPLLKPLEAIIDLTKDKDEDEVGALEDDDDDDVTQGGTAPVRRYDRKKKKSSKRDVKPIRAVIENPLPLREDVLEDYGEGPSDADSTWAERDNVLIWLRNFGPLGGENIQKLIFMNASMFDSTFGVRMDVDNDQFYIGNKLIQFDKEDYISVGNDVYHGSRGLFELLFMKDPDESVITINDRRKYKEILEKSSAHKQGYDPRGRIASSGGVKYLKVIKPLFFSHGRGLLPVTDNKIDYIRWNDPNELVDRLALLIASEQAGNKGHGAEIASIEEELREANFIK